MGNGWSKQNYKNHLELMKMSRYTIEHENEVWWIVSPEGNRQAGFSSKQDLEYALDAEENRILLEKKQKKLKNPLDKRR